jgi:peptide/nickel transport system substrate-binding protein
MLRAMPTVHRQPPDRLVPARLILASALLLSLVSCERRAGCTGEYCGTLVFAATSEPDILLPPVTQQAYARDITEQLFLKLADLGLTGTTIGDEDFQPLLAERWEWDDRLTLVFYLNPRARWQDGRPVTAADVEFTFAVYNDSLVNSPFRSLLRSVSTVKARDSLTAVFRFRRRYPEMFYDAVHHMLILPAHLLRNMPRERWRSAEFGRAPVGDGPYRFVRWNAGESIELAADSTFFLERPHIRRLIWRFTPDLQVAVTQVIAGDADAVEVLGPPDNVKRAQAAPQLALYPYRGALYGLLAFNLTASGDSAQPHPLFGDRELRRALAMAVDRQGLLKNVWGDLAHVPPGPVARIWPIWDPETRQLPYDTARAARLLNRLGWSDANRDGIRERNDAPLAFRILVPTTSALRRQYARLLQEQFRGVGADVSLDEVEFSVFNERLAAGRFDAALITRNTDPTPSSSMVQVWTSAGGSNAGHYANPAFDRLVDQATAATRPEEAKRVWRRALEVLNDDAPGVFLFAPDNIAAIHHRIAGVVIRPDSYWALVRLWRIPADQLTERDRAEP